MRSIINEFDFRIVAVQSFFHGSKLKFAPSSIIYFGQENFKYANFESFKGITGRPSNEYRIKTKGSFEIFDHLTEIDAKWKQGKEVVAAVENRQLDEASLMAE